jgi:hypothetical protein
MRTSLPYRHQIECEAAQRHCNMMLSDEVDISNGQTPPPACAMSPR